MWRPFRALPRYFGGKRKLCPVIFREIDQIFPRATWGKLTFVDAFLGGGAASLYAKGQGFGRVVCNDLARRSAIVGQALIANDRTRLLKEDVLRLYREHPDNQHEIEQRYVPDLFSLEQARFFDNALSVARASAHPEKQALLQLVLMRLMMAIRPMSQFQPHEGRKAFGGDLDGVSPNRVASYVEGLRLTGWSSVWENAEAVNDGVLPGKGEVRQSDAAEFVASVTGDVLYLDSPYEGTLAYEKAYRVLDEIFEQLQRESSRFSRSGAVEALDELIGLAGRFPLVVLSFGNERTTGKQIGELMEKHGRQAKVLELEYRHMPSLASEEKNARNRELLVLGWKADQVGR